MTATLSEAYDEIVVMFLAVWDPTGHPTMFDNKKKSKPDDVNAVPAPYSQNFLKFFGRFKASISSPNGENLWTQPGMLTTLIFVPIGTGLTPALDLAKVVVDAFEGKKSPSQILFRASQPKIIGPSGEWFQVNVITNFEFDERK